jgi:hypothetical protein
MFPRLHGRVVSWCSGFRSFHSTHSRAVPEQPMTPHRSTLLMNCRERGNMRLSLLVTDSPPNVSLQAFNRKAFAVSRPWLILLNRLSSTPIVTPRCTASLCVFCETEDHLLLKDISPPLDQLLDEAFRLNPKPPN